jgi:hypothetical protein
MRLRQCGRWLPQTAARPGGKDNDVETTMHPHSSALTTHGAARHYVPYPQIEDPPVVC